jgi:hypothetical protein
MAFAIKSSKDAQFERSDGAFRRCQQRRATGSCELAHGLHKRSVVRRERSDHGSSPTSVNMEWEGGIGVMSRAVAIAKMIGSLLAIEVFVPGGTLIVLALLLTGRPGSPWQQRIARRFPALFRLTQGLTAHISPLRGAMGSS